MLRIGPTSHDLRRGSEVVAVVEEVEVEEALLLLGLFFVVLEYDLLRRSSAVR